jgi:hypothetical protein
MLEEITIFRQVRQAIREIYQVNDPSKIGKGYPMFGMRNTLMPLAPETSNTIRADGYHAKMDKIIDDCV